MAQFELSERNDQLVVRYLHDLHADLRERLSRFYFSNVPKIIPKAEYFELS